MLGHISLSPLMIVGLAGGATISKVVPAVVLQKLLVLESVPVTV